MTDVFTSESDGADFISRQKVLDILSEVYWFEKDIGSVHDKINKLPCYSIEEGCKSEIGI